MSLLILFHRCKLFLASTFDFLLGLEVVHPHVGCFNLVLEVFLLFLKQFSASVDVVFDELLLVLWLKLGIKGSSSSWVLNAFLALGWLDVRLAYSLQPFAGIDTPAFFVLHDSLLLVRQLLDNHLCSLILFLHSFESPWLLLLLSSLLALVLLDLHNALVKPEHLQGCVSFVLQVLLSLQADGVWLFVGEAFPDAIDFVYFKLVVLQLLFFIALYLLNGFIEPVLLLLVFAAVTDGRL